MTGRVLICGLLALFTPACWGEDNPQVGSSEPFRVQNAQFVRGRFVGEALADGGAKKLEPFVSGTPVTSAPKSSQAAYYQGQSGISFSGEASTNTAAIGLWLQGVGHGYWVFPVGGPEQTGLLTWTASVDLGREIPPGLRNLRAIAIDSRGRAGQQTVSRICIKSQVPDNFNSCSPARPIPRAVISLSWDVNADLDLQVIGPDKRVLQAKTPNTMELDGGMAIPLSAAFDHDSNAGCSLDGGRFENLVWQEEMPHGRYGIYVNMFDACRQPAVRFDVSVYTAEGGGDGGTPRQRKRFTRSGELLDISANGGAQRGLFITEFNF